MARRSVGADDESVVDIGDVRSCPCRVADLLLFRPGAHNAGEGHLDAGRLGVLLGVAGDRVGDALLGIRRRGRSLSAIRFSTE